MIKITEIENKNFNCKDFVFKNKDNTLYMALGGNGDLYWQIIGKYSKIEFPYIYYDFLITKEDYNLYENFCNLYNKITNYQPKITDFELENRCCYTIREYEEIISEEKRLFENEKSKLVFNDEIIWYSEDCIKNEGWDSHFPPSWVTVKPHIDGILLQFKVKVKDKESLKYYIPDVTIRFCNDGCQYRGFNGPFMDLYNEMSDYKEENHQIHIEEYMYLTRHR